MWDCGVDRAPDLDGFAFEFLKIFWSTVENDVVKLVCDFFYSSIIPKGCNPCFITLIPKVQDSKLVKDFRPISLIGCPYKNYWQSIS